MRHWYIRSFAHKALERRKCKMVEYDLKVGDQVISERRYNGLGLLTVVRLTPKQIVIQENGCEVKIKKPFGDHNYAIGDSGWNRTVYRPLTEQRLIQFKKEQAFRYVSKFDYTNIKDDLLFSIYAQLKSSQS